MVELNILEALGGYIINPLPDIKEEDSEDYYVYPDLAEETPFPIMDIQEIKRQAMQDAFRIFETLYENNKFLLYVGDSGDGVDITTPNLDQSFDEYMFNINQTIMNLEETDQILSAIINGFNESEISIMDYLYPNFEEDIPD